MPIRCPLPQVNRPSIARTPVASGSSMRGRVHGSGGARLSDVRSASAGCGRPSMALPSASITRPSSSGPTRSQRVVRTSRTRLPRRTPLKSLKRIEARSGRRGSRPLRPAAACPTAAGSRPRRPPARETRPPRPSCRPSAQRCPPSAVGMMRSSCSTRSSMGRSINSSSIRFKLRLDLLVDRAEAGFHAAAAAADRRRRP